MAYTKAWNESAPLGTADAGTLDTIIQDVKVSLRERLEQVIPNFGTDATDPKILLEGSARILVDTTSNMPANPDFEGQCFWSSDDEELYVGVGSSWVQIPIGVVTTQHMRVGCWGTADQNLTNNTATVLNWGGTDYEYGGDFHDDSVNNSRITIPSSSYGGFWEFDAHIVVDLTSGGSISDAVVTLEMLHGGTNVRRTFSDYIYQIPSSTTIRKSYSLLDMEQILLAQYREVRLKVNMSNPSGGTPITVIGSTRYDSYFRAKNMSHLEF